MAKMELSSCLFTTLAPNKFLVVPVIVFLCLFELMLNVPLNSNGHVWMLPLFYGTFTKHKDVVTLEMCFINTITPFDIKQHVSNVSAK